MICNAAFQTPRVDGKHQLVNWKFSRSSSLPLSLVNLCNWVT